MAQCVRRMLERRVDGVAIMTSEIDNHLIDQLGAFGLLDPAQAGMLLAIRRGLIEETNAASTDELDG